ncbi:MAG TPA: hypothetical protein DGR97_13290 [Gammaproteobacteria bacterium]|nr:hypothetical protein [Gammaproteobacteria bacterium]
MAEIATFESGAYRYIRGPFQYSGGVAAEPGFAIERVRFPRPVALGVGFERIERYLRELGRPCTAFCACELRSPEPFSEEGFVEFNRVYVETLERWGLFSNDDNPVARSNVCPEIDGPAGPSFHAFCYTVPTRDVAQPSFVISGSAEVPEGDGTYEERIIRRGDNSAGALREKALYVLDTMGARMSALGVSWNNSTATHAYTVRDLHPFFADEIVSRGAATLGLTWFYARPPVTGLDYEMDVRAVFTEHILSD